MCYNEKIIIIYHETEFNVSYKEIIVKGSVEIIGGADGPTSVFVASKKKNLFSKIKGLIHKRRKAKAEALFSANPHTLEEVIQYIKDVYQAKEISETDRRYIRQRKNMKESLILKHQPELLGEPLVRPERLDKESAEKFVAEMEARSEKCDSIADDKFPIDYHSYLIQVPKIGDIYIETEWNWDVLSVSYSGSKRGKKKLSKIFKDIHLYYGKYM